MSASPEAPIPLAGVAGFNRNQWQLSIGISGNLRLESVAGFDRNQWQPSRGIRNADTFTSQTRAERYEAAARAVWCPTRVCALSLRCAAEEALQDRGVDCRGTRVGTAPAAFCRGRDGGSARRLYRGRTAGPGEAGGW